MIRFVLKHTLNYSIAGQIPMLANLLLYPIISEYLTSFDYYVFGTALGYLGLVNMAGDLGMTALFQNSFFKQSKNYPAYWSHYLGFMLTYRFFFSFIGAGAVWYALSDEVEADRLWIVITLVIAPLMLLEVPRNIGLRLLQFKHQHHIVTRTSLIAGVLAVLTTFITVYILRLGYLGFFISSFVSTTFQGLFFAWFLYVKTGILPQFKQRFSRIKKWLGVSLPLVPHQFTTYLLSSSDRIVLNQYLGYSTVTTSTIGLYNVAYNFSNYLNFFNSQLNVILSPIYFSLFRDKPEESAHIIRKITFLWLWTLIAVCVLAGLWSKEVFAFFFIKNTDGLETAYKYVIFIFFSMCFRPFYLVAVDFVIFHEKTKSLYQISTAGALLNVVLNIALIPFFGVEVAIYSTYLSYAYIGISGHHFKSTNSHIPKSYHTIWYFLLITAFATFTTYAVEFNLFIKATITLGILSAAFVWFKKFGGKELLSSLNKQQVK